VERTWLHAIHETHKGNAWYSLLDEDLQSVVDWKDMRRLTLQEHECEITNPVSGVRRSFLHPMDAWIQWAYGFISGGITTAHKTLRTAIIRFEDLVDKPKRVERGQNG
jgi:hypothetical protein